MSDDRDINDRIQERIEALDLPATFAAEGRDSWSEADDEGNVVTVQTGDFFHQIGVDGSLPSLERLWRDYRAQRVRLDGTERTGPTVEGIDEMLTVCREVRTTWSDERVAQWRKLVHGGMSPVLARAAVVFIND